MTVIPRKNNAFEEQNNLPIESSVSIDLWLINKILVTFCFNVLEPIF